jgi:hypothetical protein
MDVPAVFVNRIGVVHSWADAIAARELVRILRFNFSSIPWIRNHQANQDIKADVLIIQRLCLSKSLKLR